MPVCKLHMQPVVITSCVTARVWLRECFCQLSRMKLLQYAKGRAQSRIKPIGGYPAQKYDLLVQHRVRANPHYSIRLLFILAGEKNRTNNVSWKMNKWSALWGFAICRFIVPVVFVWWDRLIELVLYKWSGWAHIWACTRMPYKEKVHRQHTHMQ